MQEQKIIWTFWEPKETMPGYVRLCIESWKKFLPDYKVVIVDYSNVRDYIGDFYDESLYLNFPLAQQADAVRAALLAKYGGIWFDADIIVTSNKIRKYLNHPSKFKIFDRHLAVIIANKENDIVKEWASKVRNRILAYKLLKEDNPALSQPLNTWYYLGNGVLNGIIDKKIRENNNIEEIAVLNKYYIFPENVYSKEVTAYKNGVEGYINFYFKEDHFDFFMQKEQGMALLHNSWTPAEFKRLTNKNDVLNSKNTMGRVLKAINEIQPPKPYFVTQANDGNSRRLLNLIFAMYIAKKEEMDFKFIWPPLCAASTQNNIKATINLKGKVVMPSVCEKDEIFSAKFISEHYIEKIPDSSVFWKPAEVTNYLRKKDLEGLSYGDVIALGANNLKWLFGKNFSECSGHREGLRKIFEEIDFSDSIKCVIENARKMANDLGEFIAIQIRGGDSIEILSEYRKCSNFEFYTSTLEQAIVIIKENVGKKIILFGCDAFALDEIVRVCDSEKVLSLYTFSSQIQNQIGEFSEFSQYLFDCVFVSKASIIYGTIGVAEFAYLIGDSKEIIDVWSVGCLERKYEISSQYFPLLKVSATQKAFSLLHLFKLSSQLGLATSICIGYLREALLYDTENDKYRIYLVDYLLKKGNKIQAEEELREFVNQRGEEYFKSLFFQTYWTGINLVRYGELYKSIIDRNFPYLTYAASKVLMHFGDSKMYECAKIAYEAEPQNEIFKDHLLKLLLEQPTPQPKTITKEVIKEKVIIKEKPTPSIYLVSAKDRIHSHLAYKLGSAMILNSKSLLGYIRMPYVLSYIKEAHQKEQKEYQAKVAKNPKLKLPKLESYADYQEALKEKECFTYKLGEALIKANSVRGGGRIFAYLAFFKEVRRLRRELKEKRK